VLENTCFAKVGAQKEKDPTITKIVDYQAFCAGADNTKSLKNKAFGACLLVVRQLLNTT